MKFEISRSLLDNTLQSVSKGLSNNGDSINCNRWSTNFYNNK